MCIILKKSPCSILYQKLLPRFEKGNKSSNPVRALAFCKIKLSFIQFESCKTSNGNSFNIRSLKFGPRPVHAPNASPLPSCYPNCHLHCIPAGSASFRTKVQFVLHGPLKVIVPRLGDLPCAKGSQRSFSPFVPV